jgi:hypothetical protein
MLGDQDRLFVFAQLINDIRCLPFQCGHESRFHEYHLSITLKFVNLFESEGVQLGGWWNLTGARFPQSNAFRLDAR